MGKVRKIVDFFGLPGCGKSTVVNYIANPSSFSSSGFKIADKKKALECGRALFLWRYLRCFSIGDVICCIRYHNSIPPEFRRKGSPLRKFIRNYLYYRYIARYADYDYVCLDSGIVQGIASHQNGRDLFDVPGYTEAVKKLLGRINAVYVWCEAEPEVALERMESRGRNKGRIDLMKGREEQLENLREESKLYGKFAELLRSMGRTVEVVDSGLSVEEEASSLRNKIFD